MFNHRTVTDPTFCKPGYQRDFRYSPPGSRSASHSLSACFPSGFQTRWAVSVYLVGAGRASSEGTPARRRPCCRTRRAPRAHSESSPPSGSTSHWAVSRWGNGESPGSTRRREHILPDCGDSGAARTGRLPSQPALNAAQPLSDWCCRRRKAAQLRGRWTCWSLKNLHVGVIGNQLSL